MNKTYVYGAFRPTKNNNVAEEQFCFAFKYRNKLTEIERMRRVFCEGVKRDFDSEYATACIEVEKLEGAINDAYSNLREKKSGTKRPKIDAEKGLIADLKDSLRAAYDRRRDASLRIKNDPLLREQLRAIDGMAKIAQMRERHVSGLCHGTYITVEEDVERAKKAKVRVKSGKKIPKWTSLPRYKKRAETARIGVQRQQPPSVDTVFGTGDVKRDTFVQIDAPSDGSTRTVARIRVGSDDDDRSPVWCEFPIILHRPLPEGARIRRAYLKKFWLGLVVRYEFQLSLDIPDVATDRGGFCALAIDTTNGSVFVASDDGAVVEIEPPTDLQGRLAKCDDLRQIRDKNFDRARVKLQSFLAIASSIPEWLVEQVKYIAQWKAPKKLAVLLDEWIGYRRIDGAKRFAGDEAIVEWLMAWAKQDRHLLRWEEHQRARALNNRKDTYRKVAASYARQHGTLIVDNTDLRRETPADDDGADDVDGKDERKDANARAASECRSVFENAFDRMFKLKPKGIRGDERALDLLARRSEAVAIKREKKGLFRRFRRKTQLPDQTVPTQ